MSDVRWIKIVTDIFDDEKILLIETLPEADSIIVIWFKLLCLAGKQNNSGVFLMNNRMAYTDKMFSTIFRRKEATVQLALRTFEEFGMIEIIDDAVTIPNWGKHQNIDSIENKKRYMREYMTVYREQQKRIANRKNEDTEPCKTNSKTNSKANVSRTDKNREEKIREDKKENDTEYSADFITFWSEYPKKEDKVKAYKVWKKLKVTDVMLKEIIKGVKTWKLTTQWQTPKYIQNPKNWLEGRRWEDELGVKGFERQDDLDDLF